MLGASALSHLDSYLKAHSNNLEIFPVLKVMLADAHEALESLPVWERGFHLFWLLGPFILLIERTPADIWLSVSALAFAIRSVVKRDGAWLKHFSIYGDGSQTRSFCYVDDLIDGFLLFMEDTSGESGPLNLGNPYEMTIKQAAELILDLTKSKSELVYKPLPSDDPLQRCPDITKAKKTLNWAPKTELVDGLSKTIDYFKSTLKEQI